MNETYRKILPIIICLLLGMAQNLRAFHIVGGEIELLHLQDFEYRINLIQYFDRAQTDNPGPDGQVTVFIFRNSDNSFVQQVTLPLISEETVNYTNPECAIGQLQTSRVLYSTDITLAPEVYDQPEGYYIVWERCCRNAEINNIENPIGSGMTYILEFPPVMVNGERFINSSPKLFPPLSDYACINQLFYTDFAGTDIDGDSITYRLQTPLNSSAQVALPIPQPKPHSTLLYANGSDIDNIILGTPSLAITDKGFITVNPTFTGLYVFSVLVEEFRDNVKIGELRRDFQMLVVDGCEPPDPPEAEVRLPGETEFYNEVDTIRFTVGDEEKCFQFLVIDEVGSNVTFEAQGVNFDGAFDDIFNFTSGPINEDGDTLQVEVCVPNCPYVQDIPYIIDLIASDDACPLPQKDTVRLIIEVQQPPNTSPFFAPSDFKPPIVVNERDIYIDTLTLMDTDLDSIDFYFYAPLFDPIQFGMSYQIVNNEPGLREVEFTWDTDCQKYFFGLTDHFDLGLVIEDYDECSRPSGDTLFYNLNVILPPNTSPILSSSLADNVIEIDISDPLVEFTLGAIDDDNDNITLSAFGDGFVLNSIGIAFDDAEGVSEVSSDFKLNPSCQALNITEDTAYNIFFVTEDEDLCREINTDTLAVTIAVSVPFNNKPDFKDYTNYELSVNVPFSLDIIASDIDGTLLGLDLLSPSLAPPSESFSFDRMFGDGQVVSELTWTPECSLLGEGRSPRDYPTFFLAWDDVCPEEKADTLFINFTVSELEVDYVNFSPPNVFTPNGDGVNDTFFLNGLQDPSSNLPPDNCEDQFKNIIIFDRNGKTVFTSNQRDFVWNGTNVPSSTYFYQIDYLNTEYKGTVTIIR